ncbi:MAG: DNA-directed RNA polymerase subunit delta [Bacillota bacterium]|jgi:DNA-directed RNA polymerase subunit delta
MERNKRAAQSETDVAFRILKERRSPVHYRELIADVLDQLGETPANPGQRLAQIHTEINLDSRFVFVGKGMWGLSAWSPKTNRLTAPVPNERNYQPKHSDYVWEDADEDLDEDDESECLVPVDEDSEDESEDELELDEDFPLDDEELETDEVDDDDPERG